MRRVDRRKNALPTDRQINQRTQPVIEVLRRTKQHSHSANSCFFPHRNPQVFEIPYNSVNKFRVSVNELDGDERYVLTMTGAAERIIARFVGSK